MKNSLYVLLIAMAVVASSCKEKKTESNVSKPQIDKSQVTDSIVADSTEANVLAPASKATTPVAEDKKLEADKPKLENPTVEPKPETSTDKLLKQCNEVLVTLIQSSRAGKKDDASEKKFLELQSQLEEMEKNGQLSSNQKELLKVASDAYSKLNNK